MKTITMPDVSACKFPIVGESHYKETIKKHLAPHHLATGTTCTVLLVPETNNKFDPNAVRVEILGQTVGYIPKEHAAQLRNLYKTAKISDATRILTQAEIRGGVFTEKKGRRNIDVENYGIVINFDIEAIAKQIENTPGLSPRRFWENLQGSDRFLAILGFLIIVTVIILFLLR